MLSHIRQDPQIKDVPVIMMTARGLMGDREDASEKEADDFLPKPFTRKKLNPIIERLLKRQTLHVAQVEKASQEAAKLVVSKMAHEILNPLTFLRRAALSADRNFQMVLAQIPDGASVEDQKIAHQRAIDSLRSGFLRVTEAVVQRPRRGPPGCVRVDAGGAAGRGAGASTRRGSRSS